MCTVKEIREAIQENYRSQHDMESMEIDRICQDLPFSKDEEPLSKPCYRKSPFWLFVRRYMRF